MNKKQIAGLIIAVVLFILTGISSVFTNTVAQNRVTQTLGSMLTGGYQFNAPNHDYIAVVRVEGTIQQQTAASIFSVPEGYQHTTTLEYIDYLIKDTNNAGILLYVDSPGGTVYESDELYKKLEEYKASTERPIWDYMAHYAASGGYYVSAAADKIYANENTVTGSIGVIMSGYDMSGLYEKLGIRYISITSGENKDSSKLTEDQISIYQSQVDESYETFVSLVAEGRGMSQDEVKALADGRTYTAKQAKENGLVDEISLYEEMKTEMSKELGTSTFYELDTSVSLWSSVFAKAESMIPKSEAQVLLEVTEEKKSGELMYYAEQLQ